ncbi:aldo/keto reductase [Frankia sp. Mgl5]|nr:aldo/keto reductase [Frankia sp. Mgl5]MCK9929797.1 aldo/keto reductase [Frankia sp. Mgl5]
MVEQLIPFAEQAGMNLTHLATAFAVAHPAVTSTIIGPCAMEQLDDLLAGADITRDDKILEEIAAIVAPGTDVGQLDMAYAPPTIEHAPSRPAPSRYADGRPTTAPSPEEDPRTPGGEGDSGERRRHSE